MGLIIWRGGGGAIIAEIGGFLSGKKKKNERKHFMKNSTILLNLLPKFLFYKPSLLQ